VANDIADKNNPPRADVTSLNLDISLPLSLI
jgi:hypothetical protein